MTVTNMNRLMQETLNKGGTLVLTVHRNGGGMYLAIKQPITDIKFVTE